MNSKNIIIYTLILVAGLIIGFLIFGGSGSQDSHDEHDHPTEQMNGEVLYTCSMHPQIRQEGPGDCPICGMDLIPVNDPAGATHDEHDHETEEADGEVLYTCSMHPQVRQEEPGDCPICGMDLIPVNESAEKKTSRINAVTISDAASQLANIQTTSVTLAKPVKHITLPGMVMENQNQVSGVTAHFPGRIRDLYVDEEGVFVQKGQKLVSVYSPELIAAQQELLETKKYKLQNPRLYEAARQKLRFWEFPDRTIDEIEKSEKIMTELDFYSPVSGYVSEIAVSREKHVTEGALMYRVVDLSSVWVDFEAYENSITWISKGDALTFSLEAYPGEVFESSVSYIDPFLDAGSRSVTVRTRVSNDGYRLKPGMMAKAQIHAEERDQALMIPVSAVLWTGTRSIVYVQVPDTQSPTYEAREIKLGQRAGELFVVRSGLNEGEEVVTNGTFRLDSEAQLQDKLSMMNREPGTGANMSGHDHGTMEMNATEEAQQQGNKNTDASKQDHSGHQH